MEIKTLNDLIQWHKNQIQHGSCGDGSFDTRMRRIENQPHEDAIKILELIQQNDALETSPSFQSIQILMEFLHKSTQLSLDLASAFNKAKTKEMAQLGNELQDTIKATVAKLKAIAEG